MAKIFGSAKVQFHGREKELKVLREIYAEVCRRDHPKQAKQSQPEETPQDAGANGDNDNVPGGEPNDKEATREKQRRSVAFVSGISGTGKSALIREFVQNLSTTTGVPGPLFLTGKFDELAGADPFSAIVEAFGGLATMLLDDGEMLENTTDYTEDLIRIQRDVKRYLRKEDM
jgi:predicted ATPase